MVDTHAYGPIVFNVHKAFHFANLMHSEMGVLEPYRVCVVIDEVKRKKETDPETNFERIEWFFNNSVPPKQGMIVSFYENDGITHDVWIPFSSSYLWPLKERWCGMGDYVTFQKIEKNCSDRKKKATFLPQNALIKHLEENGIEVKYVDYETPIQDLYDLLIDCKFHISYIGSTYFVAPAMGVPVFGYGYNAPHGKYHEGGEDVTVYGGKTYNRILSYNQFTDTPVTSFSTTVKNLGETDDFAVENLKEEMRKFRI